nr:MAG: putative capsid protein [Permutotetraviridae sp.]
MYKMVEKVKVVKKNGAKKSHKKFVEVVVPGRSRRRNVRNGGPRNGAPVSTSVAIAPRNTERVHLKGTDRLIHVDDVGRFPTGGVVVDLSLSCSSFKRMEHMATAYQRVRFKKLVFRVVPMAATSSTGGFAAAFVSDPTDVLGSGDDALDRLVAQKGSKITKIWQSTNVVGCILPDLLYTSEPPQGDIRLSSPGRLWIVVESRVQGVNSQAVPLTVYCDWEVDFFVPSLEKGEGGGQGALIVGATFYSRKSNVGLWWKDGAGGDDPRTKIPNIEFDVTYQTKQKYYLSYVKAGNFDKFRMVNDSTHGITLAPVSPEGDIVIEVTDVNQYVFEKGDVLTPVPNLNSVGAEYLCRRMQKHTLQDSCPLLPAPCSQNSMLPDCSTSKRRQSSKPSQIQNFLQKALTPAQLKELGMESPLLLRDQSRSPSFEILDDDL